MTIYKIFGPPGTGKTTELLRLLEKELTEVPPEEIAYVSFTREGADQGKRRAMEAFGYAENRFPHFRTLHSMAFHALRLTRNMVIGKSNYKEFSDKIGMRFTGYYTEEFSNDDDAYLFFNELFRNNKRAAREHLDTLDVSKLTFVRNNYSAYKRAKGVMDFTDMIEQFVKEDRVVPVKIAFVDEAQDLTTLQWKMVWSAFKNCEKVYLAGDDDQAIYQWSGADVDYFLSVDAEETVLHHSYRLPDSVLRFAKRISHQIGTRVDKEYNGRGEDGKVAEHNSLDSIPLSEEETWMILTRNHIFMPRIEEWLQKKVVVYTINGVPSVTKEEIAAITLYEKVRASHLMSQQEEVRLVKYLRAKYDLRKPWYESFKWTEEKIAYMRDIVRVKPKLNPGRVRVATIHSSKGAEADNVVLLLDITRNVANNLQRNPDSEHRAFYVGATRAKNALHVVFSNTRNAYPIY